MGMSGLAWLGFGVMTRPPGADCICGPLRATGPDGLETWFSGAVGYARLRRLGIDGSWGWVGVDSLVGWFDWVGGDGGKGGCSVDPGISVGWVPWK
jgi:hypothetical protein